MMRILVAGDYCDCGRVSEIILRGDYGSLFDEVKPLLSQFDYNLINFEFPVVLEEGNEILKVGPCLRGCSEAVNAIKYAGFNVCTLANNHILDQGEKCCLDTICLLSEAGIETVGAGKNIQEASEILVLHNSYEKLAIINCCEHEFTIATEQRAGANPLNPIQQFYKIQEARKQADYVIVIVHGGHEYYQLPSPRMQETYRFFIDAGADMVINHHQHCYSGYEEYKGKYIFYGLGNLLFDDANKINDSWNDGYMIGLELENHRLKTFQLFPYTQCNKNVTVKMMEGTILNSFQERICRLNEIISNEKELANQYKTWLKGNCTFMPSLFEPWQGKIASALYRRGILPTTFNKGRRLKLINYIWCESHLDRLRYVFRDW